MKKNIFGDLQPANQDEIGQAMEIKGALGKEVYADVSHDPENEGTEWEGWCAEVRTNDGDDVFATLGFETKEGLVEALQFVGIETINEV